MPERPNKNGLDEIAWMPETIQVLLRETRATRALNREMLHVLRDIRDELAKLRVASEKQDK